jgi:hypothetical protein
MPESSDLSLIADRVGKAGFPYALPPVKTYWLWYYTDRELFDLGIQSADIPAIVNGSYTR